jgi:phosphoribosylaminoimidazolecarboxamide formyltransferase/IMP cyclohydrolase
MMTDPVKIRRAIISVYDKRNLIELARVLQKFDVEILSTGGTLAAMKKEGIQAISVSTFTGTPEILGGRVKTLHPKIHGGILFRRDSEDDCAEMTHQEYRPIDMVVVNLYPFEKTVSNPLASEAEIIENIDIGGPTMIRAAAKNHAGVTIVTDPDDYQLIIEELEKSQGAVSAELRKDLATRAFDLIYKYDAAIARYFISGRAESTAFPPRMTFSYLLKSVLRYGENPHQQGALYADRAFSGASLAGATLLSGKALSYNNIADLDATLEMLLDFKDPFACVVKHANPCGAASGATLAEAYAEALACDPLSAYGSIIGLNRCVDVETARLIHDTHFVECILAPDYADDALSLMSKKKNRRILVIPELTESNSRGEMVSKHIRGGILYQTADNIEVTENDLTTVTKREPTHEEIKSLLFAWKVVKHTKSNAIVIARNTATVGIGMGQTSRVDASYLAARRAGDRARGAVLASDAFFPMPDGVEVAAAAGVSAIIQPGGSKGDQEAIDAANRASMAMVFTGIRHFRH